MIDPVAWAIGELGAEHSPEVARVLAYAATGGGEGVVGPTDLRVRALSTPGKSVRVGPGAAAVLNRAAAGRSEAFVARVVTDENVAIAATGAGGGRTDLIALVVRDTSIAGNGTRPADPAKGPYVHAVVVSGVSASVKRLQDVPGQEYVSGVALARVTIPASTSTITDAMITDLRTLAQSRTSVQPFVANSEGKGREGGVYKSPNGLQSNTFVRWPHRAEWAVEIPEWATHAVLIASVHGASSRTGDVWGEVRAVLGTDDSLTTVMTAYDEAWDDKPARVSLGAAGRVTIPAAMRGTTQQVKIHGRKVGGAGHLTAMEGTASVVQVFFEERVA